MKVRCLQLVLISTMAACLTSVSLSRSAVAPSRLTVQGRLTDSGGNPPTAGNKTFTFRIYDQQTVGTEIWPISPSEVQTVYTDANGLWTAQLGEDKALDATVFAEPTRWLEITVNDGVNPPETLTRIAINTSPYAYRVATIDDADGGVIGDTLGVRDPGGNVAVYGANGVAYSSDGGAATGPQGITFINGPTGDDTVLHVYGRTGAAPRIEMRGDTGTLAVQNDGNAHNRQLLLTTADVMYPGGSVLASGPSLSMRDSSAGMPKGEVLLSAGHGLSLSKRDMQHNGYTILGMPNGGTPRILVTDSLGDTALVFHDAPEQGGIGVFTGHPTEALTVGGAIRGYWPDPLSAPVDPWVGARKSMVLAKEGADEWGRSTGDTAGIYLPANTSDFSIISSSTSATQTSLRLSVGDDPDDHILLMPSGDVGIGTTAPTAKLDVDVSSVVGMRAAEFRNNWGAGGVTKAAVTAQNTNAAGIALNAEANTTDATVVATNTTASGAILKLFGTGFAVKFRANANGTVGVNTDTPTANLDVVGTTGYNQLRMRTSYTPTSTADANGNVGDIAWDSSYVYVKTASGWKRSALTTF